MAEEQSGTAPLRWGKALANGLLAWVIGFVLYMIPSFVVAFRMGFEMGPQGVESSVISSRISETVSAMYRDSLWLSIGYTVVVALLVYWRARGVARGTGTSGVKLGLLVAAIPALMSLLSLFVVHMDFTAILDAALFCAAGYLGGRLSGRIARTSTA